MEARTRGAALVALLLSTAVTAHDHHMDKIEDGQGISADPIVRHGRAGEGAMANVCPGLDSMDAHSDTDSGLGDHIPHGHGAGSVFSLNNVSNIS
jgi:hypothetical protein